MVGLYILESLRLTYQRASGGDVGHKYVWHVPIDSWWLFVPDGSHSVLANCDVGESPELSYRKLDYGLD